MAKLFNIWKITTYQEYLEDWPAISGKFEELTDYQKSLGYQSPEEFFEKQAYAAQELANNCVGNILDQAFNVENLTKNVQIQLKKFTYQAIDYLRMNDLVITEDVRTNQTTFNNGRNDTSQININKIEQYVGSMAWRSWILANIQDLYISWAKDQKIPFILDPEHFYTKTEVDIRLADIDDQIQVQQKMVDDKLAEFNQKMEARLTEFTKDLPNDQDFQNSVSKVVAANEEFIKEAEKNIRENEIFKTNVKNDLINDSSFITKTGDTVAADEPFISKVADKLASSIVTQEYIDNQDKKTLDSAKKYADDQDATNLTSVKKYADDQDIVTLDSSKKYADDQDTKTLISAKKYTDDQDVTNLASAKKYADDQDTSTLTKAKNYSDDNRWIVGEYKYIDIKVKDYPKGWKKVTYGTKIGYGTTLAYSGWEDENDYRLCVYLTLSQKANLPTYVRIVDNSRTEDFHNYLDIVNTSIIKYDPNNLFSDIEDAIYIGEEKWKNFEQTRIAHQENEK